MQKYILQRIALTFPTIILITILTFVGLRAILPGDVVDLIIGEYGGHDPAFRERLEAELGLSDGIPEQYAKWVGIAWFWGDEPGILQGDFGKSLHSGRAVSTEVQHRIVVSLELGAWGQATAVLVSVPLGVWAAVRQDKWPDYALRSFAILVAAVPNFWIAILIITFGSLWFDWAPPITFRYLHEDPLAHLQIMLLPALIIGLTPSGYLLRLTRTQMLEVMRQDYIRTALSKGLSENTVLYKHALRNALIPIVTIIGVGLPGIISGTVIFEQIFLIPGMGRYLVEAVNNLDYPVIQGLTLMFALVLLFAVILVDVSYAYLDPRIKFS
jgi:peptide/nickel transport system permease protein